MEILKVMVVGCALLVCLTADADNKRRDRKGKGNGRIGEDKQWTGQGQACKERPDYERQPKGQVLVSVLSFYSLFQQP